MDKEFIENPIEAYEKLKAENEGLKKYIKHLHNLCGDETDKQYKYKQALTEIKEIAEKSMREGRMISGGWLCQKISEVINE